MSREVRNACFLDGLTLQNAMLAIRPTRDKDVDRRKLLPIQLACLAQLTEALVCHQEILTVPSHANSWMRSIELRNAFNEGIIRFPEISDDVMNQVELHSCQKLLGYAKTQSFQYYIGTIIDESCEGLVLKIARDYNNLKDHAYNRFLINDLEVDINRFVDGANHYWTEWSGSRLPEAITVFGAGAFCYKELGSILGVPYSPFCLRAPVCIYDDIRYAMSPLSSSRLALSIVKDQVREELEQHLPRDIATYIDLEFPFILAYVLPESNTPREIVQRAIRLRNTKGVKNFQRFVSELSESLRTGNVLDAIRLAKTAKDQIRSVLRSNSLEPSAKVKIGIAGFSVDFPIPIPEKLQRMISIKKRNSFYQCLFSRLPSLSRLKNDIRRVFGTELDLREYERMWSANMKQSKEVPSFFKDNLR